MLTLDDANSWRMREVAHYNGGKEWFGYEHCCIEQPRLRRMDRYIRKDRSVESTWRVDGQDVADLSAAVDALNRPPDFTREEIEALQGIGEGTHDLRKVLDYGLLRSLVAKNALSMEHGHSQLTDIGRAAAQASLADSIEEDVVILSAALMLYETLSQVSEALCAAYCDPVESDFAHCEKCINAQDMLALASGGVLSAQLAQAIEARRAETQSGFVEDESAVPERNAPHA